MSVILYPREVICGGCGCAMLLIWDHLFGRGSSEAIYQHPYSSGCEFDGKKLKPTGIFAGEVEEDV